jgi:iron(III) transport system substrate-binding protein
METHMRKVLRSHLAGYTAGLLCLVPALTACGGGDASGASDTGGAQAAVVFAKYNGMTGQARQDALVAEAKKEGSLTVYGTTTVTKSVADAFTKKYGIKVNLYAASTEEGLQRLLQEYSAGHYSADVFESDAVDTEIADQKGVLGDYESEYRAKVTADGQGKDWTGIRRKAFIAAYNTDVVKPADMPSQYSDFADPKWKGKLSVEIGDVDWYETLFNYYVGKGMSESDVQTLFNRIAANTKAVKGHTTQATQLAAGQSGVDLSQYIDTAQDLVNKGAPVKIASTGPVVVRFAGAGATAKAPHPAAATLYMDFLLSDGGFAVDKQTGNLPPVSTADDPLKNMTVVYENLKDVVANQDTWTKKYDQLMQK